MQIVPAWDVPMKELQRLLDTHCNAPATHLQREQVVTGDVTATPPATYLQREQAISGDAPATAISTNTNTNTITKEERERAPNGSRLPIDWVLPDDWAAWASQTRKDLDPHETSRRFADYWHGVAGAKARKVDWLATWRNWVRAEKTQLPRQANVLSFSQQDEQARRRRWEDMTGRKWPTEGDPFAGVTIDTTSPEIGHEPAHQSH